MRNLLSPANLLLVFLWSTLFSRSTAEEGTIRGGSTDRSLAAESPETRIVGGSPVLLNRRDFDYFGFWNVGCGTSLIHEDVVLTSAHCYRPDMPDATTVYFGSTFIHTGIERTVVEGRIHPSYDPDDGIYDFMLLKLNEPMPKEEASPVSLATPRTDQSSGQQQPLEYDPFTMVGFGATREGGGASFVLNQVTVYYVPHDVCASAYYPFVGVDEETEFCTGGLNRDSCQGDSGGPVINANTGELTGVIAWGAGCARPGLYGVNARVSAAYDWIQEQLCELSDNPPASCTRSSNIDNNDVTIEDYQMNTMVTWNNNDVNNITYSMDTSAVNIIPPTTSTSNTNNNQTALLSLTIEIEYDAYPTEITWTLVFDETNETVVPTEYGQVADAGQVVSKTIPDLQPGSYTFEIQDSNGDGLCGDQGCGSFAIRDDKSLLFQNDGHFFNSLAFNIPVQ